MTPAVFDTNVLVAGFLNPHGPPGRIVEWLRNGHVQAVLDDRILLEYTQVLCRPRFALPVGEVELVLHAIRSRSLGVEATRQARSLPDPDDAPFLECAWAANVPLVTGNGRHFPRSLAGGAIILTLAQFAANAAAH